MSRSGRLTLTSPVLGVIAIALLALGALACGGGGAPTVVISDEPPGANCPTGGARIVTSSDGATTTVYACDGTDGTAVTVTAEPAGDNCAAGGTRIETDDGAFYVCNGQAGSGSVTVTPELAGDNCQAGGFRLDSVSGTSYVCHGVAGANGAAGADGQSVSVALEGPGTNCPNGGFRLQSASGTSYVCHGAAGSNGAAGADGQSVSVTAESPGANCPNGGFRLQSASGTSYVCHGAPGASGANGANGADGQSVSVTAEAPGANCPNGGFRLQSASGTSYVCHGAPGTNGTNGANGADGQSVAVTPESPGTNCPNGGFRLQSASGTSYVCHGAPGARGADGQSVSVTPVAPGSDCPNGGFQLVSVNGTSYVCHGAAGADGQSVSVTPEGPGLNCPAGGYRLDSASGTHYVCNGQDTVSVTPEPAGANCANGGYRLQTTTDTYYVCNGVDGGGGGGGTILCQDADGDGRWAGCSSYDASRPGPDCDDTDPTIYDLRVGYADQDLDGHTVGGARSVCTGAMLPVIYRAAPSAIEDCNDADVDVWQTCATCVDADGDGAWTGCDGWANHPGPDCDDTDPLIGPLMPEIPDDGRDNDCAGGDAVASEATGLFVAKTGLDANPGTKAQPKLTIHAAAAAAKTAAKPHVYVAAGDYGEAVNTEVSIFGGYQAGDWSVRDPATHTTSIISGGTYTVYTQGTGRVTLDGLTTTNTSSTGRAVQAYYAPTVVTRCIMNTALMGIESYGDLLVVSSTITGTAVSFVGVNVHSGTRTTVARSTLTCPGVSTGYRYGVLAYDDNQLVVSRNTIQLAGSSDNTSTGVYLSDVRNVARIEKNTIELTGGNSSRGIHVASGDNMLVVRGNVITNSPYGYGYGLEVYGSMAVVVGNVFRDQGSSQYYAIHATGGTGSYGARVEALQNVVQADEAAHAVAFHLGANSEGSAMNNVFWLQTHGNVVEVASETSSIELYHNDLTAPAGRCLLETTAAGSYCALDIDDVNTCREAGRCAGGGGNLSAQPGFVAPATGDYHLLAGSQLVDRGYDPVSGDGLAGLERSHGPLGSVSLFAAGLAATDVDGQGRPRGPRWDIGPDEL